MALTRVALELVRLYGPLALCLFVFLETSLLFPFLPSEIVVPGAAALLVTDLPSFLVFVTAAGVGGTAGAFVPFRLCSPRRLGDARRLEGFRFVSDDRLERGRRWFRRWGQSSVCWGRFLPVLRSVISIPAGFAGMSAARFGVLTATGTVGFYAVTAAIVYYGRQASLFSVVVRVAADRPVLTVVGLLAAFSLWYVGRRWLRRS
jgi:membrane protein DedA with SNARE-associated domain